jgi:hypothetical protein
MLKRLGILLLLIAVGLVALEPFGIVMPTQAQMVGAGVLLGSLVFVIGLLWQEKPSDEREEALMDKRGKYAFYAGLAVGSIGLVWGAFNHRVDWWLVAVVATMLSIKLLRKM